MNGAEPPKARPCFENPKLTRGQEDGGDSRHFFSSAIAVCSICSDATRVSSPAGVDSDKQVLIQPQVGVHIEQVPQPQQPPQPLQPQPKQRLKNAHLQCG